MTGLFKVTYFDPKRNALNMQAVRVTATHAEEAIKRAEKDKLLKYYRVESVECLGFTSQ